MQTETTHTPGPWRHYQDTKHSPGFIEDESRTYIASMECDPVGTDKKTTLANARLIAAAPDLLAVVQRLLREDEAGEYTIGLIEDARAAIAKARP